LWAHRHGTLQSIFSFIFGPQELPQKLGRLSFARGGKSSKQNSPACGNSSWPAPMPSREIASSQSVMVGREYLS